MTSLHAALDDMSALNLGENLNKQHDWTSINMQEISKDNIESLQNLIVQFNFQLTRTKNEYPLKKQFNIILKNIFVQNPSDEYIELISVVYKLINHTRDIISGKGEYNLSYLLISELYNFSLSPECPSEHKYKILAMCKECINSFIYIPITDEHQTHKNIHPYGSWKDMKYFCNYHIKEQYRTVDAINKLNDPLFEYIMNLICTQLSNEVKCKQQKKTLIARWIPREKSKKFGWITHSLAVRFYPQYIPSSNNNITDAQRILAKRKCLTHFRQLVANLNKEINTPQIKQCGKDWKNINFEKDVTSITLRKQSNAFAYSGQHTRHNKSHSKQTEKDIEDRIQCRENYRQFIENIKSKTSTATAKGARVSITDFVKSAVYYNNVLEHKNAPYNNTIDESASLERDMINAQWENNSLGNLNLDNAIAMVDTSLSMTDDNCMPLYAAIGLGIRIAEKSKFGKRVLSFSAVPSWINLDDCPTFVEMVDKVRKGPWGVNTNFRMALDLILDAAITNNISPTEMEKITLVILSDMQIDSGKDPNDNKDMFEMMKQKYKEAGLQTHYNKPYTLPHIIFWNLRNTSGFPSMSNEPNTSMMSGINPALLNNFAKKGVSELKTLTPWKTLTIGLENTRYNHLNNTINNLFNYNKLDSDIMSD
jgi:hypothetical protein